MFTIVGVEILLVPNACYLWYGQLNQLRSRALENAFGIALANYPSAAPIGNIFTCDRSNIQRLVSGYRPSGK